MCRWGSVSTHPTPPRWAEFAGNLAMLGTLARRAALTLHCQPYSRLSAGGSSIAHILQTRGLAGPRKILPYTAIRRAEHLESSYLPVKRECCPETCETVERVRSDFISGD